jgi:hypothetical protein
MRFYRNDDMVAAVQWTATQAEADRLFGRGCWQAVDVPTDKPGLLAWLNELPAETKIEVVTTTAPVPATAPSIAEQSLALDDGFDALPLARQLDLAARAMENARQAIKP